MNALAPRAVHVTCKEYAETPVVIQMNPDPDAWIRVWQLPRAAIPSRAFSTLWDARPRAPTHVLMKFGRSAPEPLAPCETARLTRSFGYAPPFKKGKLSYMFADAVSALPASEQEADAFARANPPPPIVCELARAVAQCPCALTGSESEPEPKSGPEPGQEQEPKPWNQATVNWYRDGDDCLPMHADWSDGLLMHPPVSSVTLAPLNAPPRMFTVYTNRPRKSNSMRPDAEHDAERDAERGAEHALCVNVDTHNGTVIQMGRAMQTGFVHGLPRAPGHTEPRINVSFRSYARTQGGAHTEAPVE